MILAENNQVTTSRILTVLNIYINQRFNLTVNKSCYYGNKMQLIRLPPKLANYIDYAKHSSIPAKIIQRTIFHLHINNSIIRQYRQLILNQGTIAKRMRIQ